MKTYKEMADSVFERSNEIIREKKRKKKIVSSVVCCFAVVLLAAGLTGALRNNQTIKAESTKYAGQNDVSGTFDMLIEPDDYEIETVTEELKDSQISENAIVGAPSKNPPKTVYRQIPRDKMTYEKAKSMFGYPIVECTADDFYGYSISYISPDGDINNKDTDILSVNYEFKSGTVIINDEKSLNHGKITYYDHKPYDYDGSKFYVDENANVVYYVIHDDIIMMAMCDGKELNDICKLLKSLEF